MTKPPITPIITLLAGFALLINGIHSEFEILILSGSVLLVTGGAFLWIDNIDKNNHKTNSGNTSGEREKAHSEQKERSKNTSSSQSSQSSQNSYQSSNKRTKNTSSKQSSQESYSQNNDESTKKRPEKPKNISPAERYFSKVLNLNGAVSKAQIKTAYRGLAKQYHPDN